jgi:hypothetical protein
MSEINPKLLGRELGPPWHGSDDEDDWEWRSAADDTPEELTALWQGAVTRSRAAVAEALTRDGLGQLAAAHALGSAAQPAADPR